MFEDTSIFDGLLTNLLSEGIGILVTVFLVDRIVARTIKKQEEKTLQPLKDILYAKLTRQLYKFLRLAAPATLKNELEKEYGQDYYYYYGNVLCLISSFFHNGDYPSLQGYYQKSNITDLCKFHSGVEELKDDFERTMDTSGSLMDPVLLKDSYVLLENLNRVMDHVLKPGAESEEVMGYSVDLANSVEKAINLMNALLAKATIKNSAD